MKKEKIIENGVEYTVKTNLSGTQLWYYHGKTHRVDGPAIIWTDGTQVWHLHGKAHREGEPAVTYPNGDQEWWLHGERHRTDGPAIIWVNKPQQWSYQGKLVNVTTQQEFEQWLKLRAFQ